MKLLQMMKKMNRPALATRLGGSRGLHWGRSFMRRGLVAQPVIVVRGCDGSDLIETITANERDGTLFGPVSIGSGAGVVRTFSIENSGSAPLSLGCVGIEGSGATEFEVAEYPEPVLLPGAATSFTIRYRATQMGDAIALVLIPSNDPSEHPYMFEVEGCAYSAAFARV